jgi:phage terminase large subunit
MQLWVLRSFQEIRKEIVVSRLTFPALRLTAMADFQDVLERNNLEEYFRHHKSLHYFENTITRTRIHFISSDKPQKIKGQGWDYVHLVEADEIPYETFRQYLMRLKGQMYMDFNPSDPDTWINVELEQKRDDIEVFQSSYLHNPFLNDSIVREIEYLRGTDRNYWQIYGLGEYGNLIGKIWDGWQPVSSIEYNKIPPTDIFYGVDFGYVNPTAIVEVKYYNENVYLREIYYQSYKDIDDAIARLEKTEGGRGAPIYADPASPEKISEMLGVGLSVMKANKRVRDGLDYVRRFKNVYVHQESENLWKEYRKYKYVVDKEGKITDQPVKFDDHLCDAVRYALVSHLHWVFTR